MGASIGITTPKNCQVGIAIVTVSDSDIHTTMFNIFQDLLLPIRHIPSLMLRRMENPLTEDKQKQVDGRRCQRQKLGRDRP